MSSTPQVRTIDEHVAAVLARIAAAGGGRPRAEHPRREARPAGPGWLPLDAAAGAGPGLVLADDVAAPAPVPGFDHAAVDGYAVRLADLPGDRAHDLAVAGTVRAGDPGPHARGPGEAARIMTGAPLPPGADAVVPVEATSTGRFVPGREGSETTVTLTRPHKDNVRRRGADIPAGTVLARRGDAVTPALIAAAAASGVGGLSVAPWPGAVPTGPRVAVVSTGSELRPAGADVGAGDVVDSNSLMLAAIVRAAGGEPVRRGGVPDDAAALRAALDELTGAVDLVVTTGGVSAGAWDVVREVLTAPGTAAADVDLTGVAMRPGRPQGLATWRGVPWVALPGTPVAAFVAAHLFVRPALAALRDETWRGGTVLPVAPHAAGWPAAGGSCGGPGPFTRVVPVRTTADGVVRTAGSARGGHALSALLDADALALVPADGARPGDLVEVVPL